MTRGIRVSGGTLQSVFTLTTLLLGTNASRPTIDLSYSFDLKKNDHSLFRRYLVNF